MRRLPVGPAFLTLSIALATAFSAAADSKSDQPGKPGQPLGKDGKKTEPPAAAAAPSAGPRTYTNDDLLRLFGSAPAPAPTEAPAAAPAEAGTPARTPTATPAAPAVEESAQKSALEIMAEQQKAEAERREKVAKAESRVAQAESRVRELERRALAVRNPYLAPPTVSKDEHEDWSSLDAAKRAEMTDTDLQKAREEVEQSKKALDQARRSP
jgi:hypothetical protein